MHLLPRFLGRYELLDDSQPDFVASDALSLGLLAAREDAADGFYRRAFDATCRGLQLAEPGRGLAWLTWAVQGGFDPPEDLPHRRATALQQLVRLRRAMKDYCDEWGSVLEGDLWGTRLEEGPLRTGLAGARDWYRRSRLELLRGLATFDPPLLHLLGWDVPAAVPYATLTREHGYPSSEELDF